MNTRLRLLSMVIAGCTALAGTALAQPGGGDGMGEPPATGACCTQRGACFVVAQTRCENMGGTYNGDGTTCEDAECTTPEPPATGACCLRSGRCIELSERRCNAYRGTYNGDGSTCDDTTCETPEPPARGACCFLNGNCRVTTAERCDRIGGTYNGDDTSCEDAACEPAPRGACCLPRGVCAQAYEARCEAAGGTYNGDGTDCEDTECALTACACDINEDGILGPRDVMAFINDYFDEDGADFNGDGESTRADLMDFLDCVTNRCAE